MSELMYRHTDMVRVSCNDCRGCCDCCRDMGQSIVLDPYDLYLLYEEMGMTFAELMQGTIELHVENGIILPNLRMVGEQPHCGFLSDGGRCSIHDYRPGICRLFPLGRSFEKEEKVQYFVLEEACPAAGKSKIRVSEWLGHRDMKQYEQFLIRWHGMKKMLMDLVAEQEEQLGQKMIFGFLKLFYEEPYKEGFYQDFYDRCRRLEAGEL